MLSGGLDSIVATHLAMKDFEIDFVVTFDYGQRAVHREIETVRRICQTLETQYRVIKLPWLKDETSSALTDPAATLPETTAELVDSNAAELARAVWVPNRNGVFVAVAAAVAESHGCNAIIAGFNAEEAKTFPDNSMKFIKRTNVALQVSTMNGVRLVSPTVKMQKTGIAKQFLALGLDPQLFWCCYDGGEKLCGKCESCVRTIRAFRKIGKFDEIKARFNS